MIPVTPTLSIDERDISEWYSRSGGPGGQNVNKVNTAVKLCFLLHQCTTLPAHVRQRLRTLAGHRLTGDGDILIDARRYRTQEQNRADALQRLTDLIVEASHVPKPRYATRAGRGAHARRLEQKKNKSGIKKMRTDKIDLE